MKPVILRVQRATKQPDDPAVRNRWLVTMVAADGSVAARNIPFFRPGEFQPVAFLECLLTDAEVGTGHLRDIMRDWDMDRATAVKAQRAATRAKNAINAAFNTLRGGEPYVRLNTVAPDVRDRYLSMVVRSWIN